MRAETTIYRPRARHSPRRIALRRAVFLTAVVVVLATVVGLVFAGSPTTLAAGTTVAGVDVGGLSQAAAVSMLEQRSTAVANTPVIFTAGGRSFALTATQLDVSADWRRAVATAAAQTDGAGPVRGFERLRARIFGVDVSPRIDAYGAGLRYKLGQIAAAVDRGAVNARLVRRGLSVQAVEGHTGRGLDRAAATAVVLSALSSFERGAPVALPVKEVQPAVAAADLVDAQQQAETAMSAPVRLVYGETHWRVPRWRIAPLLQLPRGGTTDVTIAGRAAEQYFNRLSAAVSREPQDARFQVTAAGTIAIHPSAQGLELDVPATAKAIAAAAFSADSRTANLVVRVAQPARTTSAAEAMGITGVVSSYTTTYGGTPGRLANVALVSKLIDGALIKPGATFSFNGTTGERTAAKGFQEAPVIINGELQNGLGGGVCQVSTTVFNAAFDAGLPITARTNHALYIDHYPLGRDATVNYPDIDLRFVNDTGHWLLLRTFVGTGSLTVNLYGTPVHRRVTSTTEPLTVTGPIPVEATDDPTLAKGKRVTDGYGSPPRETSVHRLVYDANGKLLHDDTWRSYYVGEPTLVRVGTKAPAKEKQAKGKAAKEKPAAGVSGASGPTAVATAPGAAPGATVPGGAGVTTPAQPR